MSIQQLSTGALVNERYRIVDILGQGGVGTVYLAEHIQLDTLVALKEVHAASLAPASGKNRKAGKTAIEARDVTSEQDALEQCRREGRMLVRLDHPNLPKVTDAFIENSGFYLAMEYVAGVTAEQQFREGDGHPLAVESVLEWGIQIAAVLSYLHSQTPPIIFRDLKPNNIIVQPNGVVKLVDFGIARRFNPDAQNDTIRLGSVGFSPPEQFGLQQTGPRSDLYSLGATLHHLLTGYDPSVKPFRFPAAIQLNPAVPPALSELIDRCVALELAMRPPDALEVGRELIAIRDATALSPPTVSPQTVGAILMLGNETNAALQTIDNTPNALRPQPESHPQVLQTVSNQSRESKQKSRVSNQSRRSKQNRKRFWLLAGITLTAVCLSPLAWTIPGTGRHGVGPANHPYTARVDVIVPSRLPKTLLPLRANSHARGNTRKSGVDLMAGRRSMRRRTKRARPDFAAGRSTSHHQPTRPVTVKSRERAGHSAQIPRSKIRDLPTDQLHDTDLEAVFGGGSSP